MPIKPLKTKRKLGCDPVTDHGRFVLQLVRNSDFANGAQDGIHLTRTGRCFALRPNEVKSRSTGWRGRNDPDLPQAAKA
jgi:hypothetical protein